MTADERKVHPRLVASDDPSVIRWTATGETTMRPDVTYDLKFDREAMTFSVTARTDEPRFYG